MTLNEYQEAARRTACYPRMGEWLLYPALKLAGEAGEVAEKVGKYWRNDGCLRADSLSDAQREALAAECGDVLWYLSEIATSLGLGLDDVARMNLEKLADRQLRGVIKSEGDDR